MPKYENVTNVNFSSNFGESVCRIRQGSKFSKIDCRGIVSGAIKVGQIGIGSTDSNIKFDKKATCEIETKSHPFNWLKCRKGGK